MHNTPQPRAGIAIAAGLAGVVLGAAAAYVTVSRLRPPPDAAVPAHAAHARAFAELSALAALTSAVPDAASADWPAAWDAVVNVVSGDLVRLDDYRQRVADIERRATALHEERRQLEDRMQDFERQADDLIKTKAALNNLRESNRLKIEDLERQLAAAREQLAARPPTPDRGWPLPGAAPATPPDAATPAAEKLTRVWDAGSSTLLREAAYDTGTRDLQVTLADGTVLRYRDVPRSGFEQLRKARQVDTHFRLHVIGAYPCDANDAAAIRAVGPRR